MNEIKAKIATVKFGHIEIEGLQATDGSYGIAISQIARILSIPQKNIQRELTTALNGKIPFLKLKTELARKVVV